MKRNCRVQRHLNAEVLPYYLILLSLCFFIGIFSGHIISRNISADDSVELYQYLSNFFRINIHYAASDSFLSALLLYYRYPILAFLFGFSSIGVIGLPFLSAAFGFFSSFSVGCFVLTFGKDGILLAFAAFGFRCLLTSICYYLIAVPAFKNAVALTLASFGRTRNITATTYHSIIIVRFLFCTAVLFFGVLIELYIIPHLLKLVCTCIFI